MEFDESLQNCLNDRREEMLIKWNRVLPTNELLFDRWEKAKLLKFGDNSSIYDSSVVMGDVKVGKNVWIGPYTLLDGASGKLEIGDYCNISSGVQIYTHDTVKSVLSGGKLSKETGDVFIGNNTYIGSMTLILKNVRIGHHCVIGAKSFVNKDIPDYSIALGTPARIVGRVIIEEEIKLEYFDKK